MNHEFYYGPKCPVLLVDDDISALESWEMLLTMGRIRNIVTCPQSQDVMDTIATQNIGVIVLDIHMPHLSEDELLSLIVREYPDIPR